MNNFVEWVITAVVVAVLAATWTLCTLVDDKERRTYVSAHHCREIGRVDNGHWIQGMSNLYQCDGNKIVMK